MAEEKKRDLIFRVMYLNENVRTVCAELGLNFSSGRNLVQKYKKTGSTDTVEKKMTMISQSQVSGQTSGDSGPARKHCPLALMFFEGDKLSVVAETTFTPEDERKIIELHNYIVRCTSLLK